MSKAYIIARIDITDPEAYAVYLAAATEALKTSSGRMLVRGGRYEALEGQARGRNVVVEFDSFDEARSYYFSELYQTAKTKREGAAIAEFVLVEGV
jgi:uncharacterized protein (DUF1330 family)